MDDCEQLCLWEKYEPQVNDYVIWDKGQYGTDEGWVYFKDDEYITIETGLDPNLNLSYNILVMSIFILYYYVLVSFGIN